jgi:hypothetical protein
MSVLPGHQAADESDAPTALILILALAAEDPCCDAAAKSGRPGSGGLAEAAGRLGETAATSGSRPDWRPPSFGCIVIMRAAQQAQR